jgi:hypothetical protein
MNVLVSVVLFIVLVLVYLNVQEQFQQGRDLEIYEIDYENKYALHRILKKRQPVLFQMKGVVVADSHHLHVLSLDKYAQKYGKERVFLSNLGNESIYLPFNVPRSQHMLDPSVSVYQLIVQVSSSICANSPARESS